MTSLMEVARSNGLLESRHGNRFRLPHGRVPMNGLRKDGPEVSSGNFPSQNHGNRKPANSIMWDVPAPPKVIERDDLQIGQVLNYFDNRGFGFLETPDGQLFFHASGFRIPRMAEVSRPHPQGKVREIHLAYARPRNKDNRNGQPSGEKIKSEPIPLPDLTPGLPIMFLPGERDGKKQATQWILQEMYIGLRDQLTGQYEEELQSFERLCRYRLDYCELKPTGDFHFIGAGTGQIACKKQPRRTLLFEGTNTDFLSSWFKNCRDSYPLSTMADGTKERWLELYYQEWDGNTRSYVSWKQAEDEVMHEFLG